VAREAWRVCSLLLSMERAEYWSHSLRRVGKEPLDYLVMKQRRGGLRIRWNEER